MKINSATVFQTGKDAMFIMDVCMEGYNSLGYLLAVLVEKMHAVDTTGEHQREIDGLLH